MKIRITTHEALAEERRAYWRARTPEERLSEVERLRIEAGKFLFKYPVRMQKVITIKNEGQGG